MTVQYESLPLKPVGSQLDGGETTASTQDGEKSSFHSVVDARYGRMFYFPEDDPIGVSLVAYGEWAEVEIQVLSAFIGLGSAVVDIGANIGTHTLAFSRRVGSHGSVRAFEPQRTVLELLERTIAANDCRNVTTVHAGVGRSTGEMLVPAVDCAAHVNVGGVALRRPKGDAREERTSILALDDLALEACHLVKIDAEGMEEDVLAGMAGTIQRLRPVLYVGCNTVDIGAAIFRAIDWPDYRLFLVSTAVYNPENYRGSPKNFFGVACESSLLCVPAESLELVPSSSPLVEVLSVTTIQELAEHLLATPRYGDASDFDRDPARLRHALAIATEDLARLKFRDAKFTQQIANLTQQNADLTQQIANLTQQNADLTQQIERSAVDLRSVVANRDHEIAQLHYSISWRVTAPLRRMSSALRRLPAPLRVPIRGVYITLRRLVAPSRCP
jgi:FkbM family methyltransferase